LKPNTGGAGGPHGVGPADKSRGGLARTLSLLLGILLGMCRRGPRFEDLDPAQQYALKLGAKLSAVARSLGALDLALGATLAPLFDRGLLCQLSYARESDYARERLGISPSEMFSCVRLARELRHRPILRQAVTAGAVSKRKALAVLPLAVGDYEGAWTEAAMRLSVRELESAAKAAGSAVPEERFEAEVIVLPMTPEQQDRLDAALALAKEDIGPEAKRWQCMEAISLEFLSSFAEWDREGPGEPAPEAPPAGAAAQPRPMSAHAARVVARQLAAIGEAFDVIRKIEEEVPGDDAMALDARALRLVAARRRYDETLGILARQFKGDLCHELLRYGFDTYCEERLGMRGGAVRQRIWLEGRMQDLPSLRAALSSGRIAYTKAVVVARRATWADVDERIARAEKTTCQQLEKEAQEEQDRENRGKCTRELWAPSDAAQTVRDAIAAAQRRALAEGGVAIDAGEALAVVADHFVEVKEAHRSEHDLRGWMSRFRRDALMRSGGLCAVPGCSRAATHVHHIVFRSRGGRDEPWNGVALCAVHHLHGIHMGYLEVTGRAGERLHWKFATGEAVPTEEWVTLGDDDVRRANAGAASTAAGGRAPPRGAGVTDVESPAAAQPNVTDVESAVRTAAAGSCPDRVTDVESDAASSDDGFVAEAAAPAYLHDHARADDRPWILACEEARAA
jgi:hypothetical protein